MTLNTFFLKTTLLFLMLSTSLTSVLAGYNESELRNEISFLAKKLLDMSGENELTIKQPSINKPYLGICGEPSHNGVLLTCVTPGHNAQKAGLKTGDVIISINGVSMLSQQAHKHDSANAYYKMMGAMKTDDILKLTLLRHGKERQKDVPVGKLSQPSYTLIIKRD